MCNKDLLSPLLFLPSSTVPHIRPSCSILAALGNINFKYPYVDLFVVNYYYYYYDYHGHF